MTFTTANWDTPQTVTVTGVDDDDATHESVVISHAIAGSDYAAVTSANVTATVTDDELPFATLTLGTQTWSTSNISLVPTSNNVLGVDYWTTFVGATGSEADNDGYFYTWDAAMNVCPSGWRLPSDDDWAALEEAAVAGVSGVNWATDGWRDTTEGTSLKEGGSSGFEAKLTGYRYTNGGFYNRGGGSYFWTSTESGDDADDYAIRRYLTDSNTAVYRSVMPKVNGFSVRCVKD
jgi:uncharacterized protein (TIGR02145 family)